MNKELLEEYNKKLLAEQKRLRKILSSSGKYDGPGKFPGDYKPEFKEIGDEADENASEVTQYETDLALTKSLEAKLEKVDAALMRIADGTYGKDKDGKDISEERLKAVPEADE